MGLPQHTVLRTGITSEVRHQEELNRSQDTTGTELELNYVTVPVWQDEDDDDDGSTQQGVKVFKVSDKTRQAACQLFHLRGI